MTEAISGSRSPHPDSFVGTREDKKPWSPVLLRLLLITILFSAGFLTSCDNPGDLEAVSGIEGEINIQGQIPDSIKAVALVILTIEVLEDQENIPDYLIAYSDPVNQTGDYSIQLKPERYIGILVGLLVDPALFVVNIDEYLDAPELPLVQLSEPTEGVILIREEIITAKDWQVSF